uniref:Putative 41 kDa salivary secreted protein n=1 Tax=Culex tarsalis TaxID=7177 RepID=A0A1Q3EUY1_CULTA
MNYLLVIWSSVLLTLSVTADNYITISIGNSYNTQAGSNNYRTRINGLTIVLRRWFGKVTVSGNGNQIEVLGTGNDSTTIRIGLKQNPAKSKATSYSLELPASSEILNNTIPSRRKRETGFLPILPNPPTPFVPSVPPTPAIPIPTMNSNYISIDGKLVRLPDSIANSTINAATGSSPLATTGTMKQPWQFLQTLIERRPSKILDPLVEFLANNYLSTGKMMVDKGLTALGATEAYFYNIANTSLNYATDQVSLGLQGVTRSFNGLTLMKRTCVGGVPEDAGRRVMERSTGCVRERLDEVIGIVDQFRSNVEATEGVFSGWLIEMQKCNAKNFPNLADSELDVAQRQCYSQALVSPTGKLIDIPQRWTSLALRTYTAVNTFQAQIGLCVAKVGLEIAAISAEFGSKITSCALRLI